MLISLKEGRDKPNSRAPGVSYGLGFQKYYLFTAYIFTKKQAKYVLQKNKYSLALEN